jgi:hypothetical protein
MEKYNKDWLKPSWDKRRDKYEKDFKENEENLRKFRDNNPNINNIDMGGGSRSSEQESSWYSSDTY